ncbi:ogr/Delta-like zinc finger family protein [Stenotrophomonas sp. B1-1]|uniref:ogr/Delta-like zinc finger family protein n=1 Tax=Stenotrophomonas sp. B1-1 TaxID=2710648 RepID=UPI0013D9DD0F|nr:ogr/Delta-like zinc finger family protein [Stenotrophomonas sp. B1-1]
MSGSLSCPHCSAQAVVRTSRSESPLLRLSTLTCRNAACGHQFEAYTEIVCTISPSACASGEICLPTNSHEENRALRTRMSEPESSSPGANFE